MAPLVSSDTKDIARHLNTCLITEEKKNRLLSTSVKCSFCHTLEPNDLAVVVRQTRR